MKVLNQEAIRRMISGGTSSAVAVSVGGGGDGGLTPAWVEGNYISKSFFSQLFTIHGTKTVTDPQTGTTTEEEVEITPNQLIDDEYDVTDVEVKFGLWTQQFLSALGKNSSGGGGGGDTLTEPLASINNAGLGAPTAAGQVITWNGSEWIFDIPQGGGGGGSVTSVGLSAPTGFTVNNSPVTSAGTIQLGFATGYSLPTNAKQSNWDTAYGWGNHANAGYLTSSDIQDMATETWVGNQGYLTSVAFSNLTSHPTTLSGYGITDAMLTKMLSSTSDIDTLYDAGSYRFEATAQGTWPTGVTANYGQMLVICGGGDTVAQMFFPWADTQAYLRVGNPMGANNGSWRGWKRLVTPDMNVASATKLATARTLWGQSFDGTANVSGNMSSVGFITMSGNLTMNNNTAVRMKDNSENIVSIMTIDSGGNFVIGETVDIYSHNTYIRGANFIFQQGTTSVNRKELFRIDSTGNLHMKQYNTHLSMRSSANADYNVLTLNTDPNAASSIWHLALGYGTANVDYGMRIFGGATTGIKFYCGQSNEVASVYRAVDSNQNVRQGIRIGDGLLSWDSANNAFKVSKIDSGGNEIAANLYALGGVSALGMSGGTSPEISNLTVNNTLTVGNELNVGDAYMNSDGYIGANRVYLAEGIYLYYESNEVKLDINGTKYRLYKISV